MPKLKPETQIARRSSILDAAEACFARAGFHRTTMQDICKAATVSPGALYLYFPSKEDLIAGLCAREREIFEQKIKALSAAPDFLAALEKIAEHYFVDDPVEKRLVAIEMAVEATRNVKIATICHALEDSVTTAFGQLFQRLADEGRIKPDLSIAEVTQVFHVMGDGLFWRRAVIPGFDARAVLPAIIKTLRDILKPVAHPTAPAAKRAQRPPPVRKHSPRPTAKVPS